MTGLGDLGAVLLNGLLLSIAEGRPFQSGNARRLAAIAALLPISAITAASLQASAAQRVQERIGMGGEDAPPVATSSGSLDPIVIALLLLAFAEAFRRGSQLTDDVDGLI